MRATSVSVREVASAVEAGRFGVLDVGDMVTPGDDTSAVSGSLNHGTS